ncbi:hypothetical protein [Streptomyces gobiensis]|uniref:hypothetical protein n=1 Tax=Streptomyces gobiensis TaxID=2875706 RepID=UPI001E4667DD|nr:hypothetical protein [Streptomyces gobiensis]UGY93340.1 hypothetical protein test1122_17545 [Streptomyces gobiensis]
MSPPDRKEEQVRRLLDGPHPPVPPDLTARAALRGHRLLRRRRAARAALWALLCLAVLALTVWAVRTPPAPATPPGFSW